MMLVGKSIKMGLNGFFKLYLWEVHDLMLCEISCQKDKLEKDGNTICVTNLVTGIASVVSSNVLAIVCLVLVLHFKSELIIIPTKSQVFHFQGESLAQSQSSLHD